MALKKTITFADNFGESSTFDHAYIRVASINGGKSTMAASVEIYKSDGCSLLRVMTVPFIPDLDGENFIKQAYINMKMLPEFAGAEDC